MSCNEVDTPFGKVWLHGVDTGRPVLLIIHGAFAEFEAIGQVHSLLFDVFQVHLPGNHCPALEATSLGVWAAAYSRALQAQFPERTVAVAGMSTGALVALALRSPQVKHLVLVEPPLRPATAWPLHGLGRTAPAWGADFLWNVLGIGPDRVEERDYTHLMAHLATPATVLLGSEPLMPRRPFERMPSLIDEETRTVLAAHPLVEVWEAEGAGHNIPRDAGDLLERALDRSAEVILRSAVSLKRNHVEALYAAGILQRNG